MSESSRHITDVLLRVSADPGHGGPYSEYKIDSGAGGYTVTLRISRLVPRPTPPGSPRPPAASVSRQPEPSHLTEVLVKERRQVEEFMDRLSTEFNVYELTDLSPAHPFLHPTFYSFSFRDSAGRSHGFEYHIECSNHLDEKYRRLVEEFQNFFESARVFDKFFGS